MSLRLLTYSEAARLLGRSREFVAKLAAAGYITPIEVGGRRYVRESALEALGQGAPPTPPKVTAPARPPRKLPRQRRREPATV